MSGDWVELVYQADKDGNRRVVRMVYEICTFQALRDQLRCREIWVVGADKWRNPAQDLPTDFEERRVEHYGKLRKPLDPTEFIDSMREEMRTELEALHAALSKCSWLEITERRQGAIKSSPTKSSRSRRSSSEKPFITRHSDQRAAGVRARITAHQERLRYGGSCRRFRG
ncbi:hypothetical protein [Nocardia sp. NPDC004260]